MVDDEPDLRTLYELTLVREGYAVDTAGGVEAGWELLMEGSYDLLITDLRLPDGTGLDLVRRLEAARRRERAVVITAYGSAENAVEALKAGAYDYLTKPVDLKQFRGVIASALGRAPAAGTAPAGPGATALPAAAALPRASFSGTDRRQAPRSGGAGDNASATLARMVGHSPVMRDVRGLIAKVARSMAPVLVHGESGTGKELVARSIHEVSSRAGGPFIAVNCGAIPEALLEAEFFGYRRGAFTGALEDREGFFQAAAGGTLFLDEIGDLPLAMQSKLLRVIQERAVRPVGATAEVPVDVRIVSATHKALGAEVQAARFRQDLFYRLNVIQIRVPPLRDRPEDLAEICASVLARIAREARAEALPLSDAAVAALARHAFPGNVRELENLLHRAAALCNGVQIDAEDLGLGDAESGATPQVPAPVPAAASARSPAAELEEAQAAPAALPEDLSSHLDAVERDLIQRALRAYRNNRTAAGAALGLSLRQIRYRMARLGIHGGDAADDRAEDDAPLDRRSDGTDP